MTEITTYIQAHWVAWLFAILSLSMGVLYRKLDQSLGRHKTMSEGVHAMLRHDIITMYNHYKDKKYCPIYAKENIRRLYKPYKDLGGNGVIEKLVDELLSLPTERKDDKK